MSQADDLNGLITEATALLNGSQQNLQSLVETLNRHLESMPGGQANGHQATADNVESLREQAVLLLRQNEAMSAFVGDNLSGAINANYPLTQVELLQRQEEERARTAKDLEHINAQLLANAIFELAAVKRLIVDQENLDTVMDGLTALQQELEQGLTDLRLLIADLEPNTVLGNFGLVAGLRRYLEKFSENTGLQTALHVQTTIEPLPPIIETAIFRIIQETLKNIRLHANASNVQITIAEADSQLTFTVLDDGIGISPSLKLQEQRQLGLVSIKETARLLNGSLQLKSEKNKGTAVILSIPNPKF